MQKRQQLYYYTDEACGADAGAAQGGRHGAAACAPLLVLYFLLTR
jgi:hypothetical protein